MALVSEFLGQLTLNFGVGFAKIKKEFKILSYTVLRSKLYTAFFYCIFQSSEPTYPTVVPAADFDPEKDAARIETAIKTKGEQNILFLLLVFSFPVRDHFRLQYSVN